MKRERAGAGGVAALWLLAMVATGPPAASATIGAGALWTAPHLYPTTGSSIVEDVAIGDFTGDGRNDVALNTAGSTSPEAHKVFLYVQSTTGTLIGPQVYATDDTGSSVTSIEAADLTGDGVDDVAITVTGSGGGIDVFPGTPSGLGASTFVTGITLPNQLEAADMDGDGDTDLVTTSVANSKVWVLTNDGTGTSFTTTQVSSDLVYQLGVGDVTSDGRVDIIEGSGVRILTQQPDGTFVKSTPTPQPSVTGVAVGDVTSDGAADLVGVITANVPSAGVAVFKQVAGAIAGGPTTYSSFQVPSQVRVMDMDVDGRNDVVVLHEAWSAVGVYRQLANGTLKAETVIATPNAQKFYGGLDVGDLNSDGLPDIAIAADQGLVTVLQDPGICTIKGTEANDTLDGTTGPDVICGYEGNDVLRGMGGNDIFLGDAGNDTITTGRGDDTVDGGLGTDVLKFAGVTTTGQSVNLTSGTSSGGYGIDSLTGVENVTGGPRDDVLTGSGFANQLVGAQGNDQITGGAGVDQLRGGPGSDTLDSADGAAGDRLDGGGDAVADTCSLDPGDIATRCS